MLKHTPKDQRFTRGLLARLAEEQEQLQKAAAESYNQEDQPLHSMGEDEDLDFQPTNEDQELEEGEEEADEELLKEEQAAHSHAQFLAQHLDSMEGELEDEELLEENQEDLNQSVQKSGYAQKVHLSSGKAQKMPLSSSRHHPQDTLELSEQPLSDQSGPQTWSDSKDMQFLRQNSKDRSSAAFHDFSAAKKAAAAKIAAGAARVAAPAAKKAAAALKASEGGLRLQTKTPTGHTLTSVADTPPEDLRQAKRPAMSGAKQAQVSTKAKSLDTKKKMHSSREQTRTDEGLIGRPMRGTRLEPEEEDLSGEKSLGGTRSEPLLFSQTFASKMHAQNPKSSVSKKQAGAQTQPLPRGTVQSEQHVWPAEILRSWGVKTPSPPHERTRHTGADPKQKPLKVSVSNRAFPPTHGQKHKLHSAPSSISDPQNAGSKEISDGGEGVEPDTQSVNSEITPLSPHDVPLKIRKNQANTLVARTPKHYFEELENFEHFTQYMDHAIQPYVKRYARVGTTVTMECRKLRDLCASIGVNLAQLEPPGKPTVYTTLWAVNRMFRAEGPIMSDVTEPLLSKIPNIRRWGRKLYSHGPPRMRAKPVQNEEALAKLAEIQEAMDYLDRKSTRLNSSHSSVSRMPSSA